MVLVSNAITHQIKVAGNVFKVKYFTETIGSVYDDDRTVTQSGADTFISGLYMSLDNTQGSDDQVLMEQGRLKYNDSKIYFDSSVETGSGVRVFTIEYSGASFIQGFREIQPGTNIPQYYGVEPFKRIFVRDLVGGSLF